MSEFSDELPGLDELASPGPTAHVVLHRPEIPQNTGNIARTCVATGASLWVVKPIPFQMDEKAVRRAGLDYWPHLDLHMTENWQQLRTELPEDDTRTYWYFSRWATRSIWDVQFARGDVLVFGSETSGLPTAIREAAGPKALLRLPTTKNVRSLNLSNTVAAAVYELLRQQSPE